MSSKKTPPDNVGNVQGRIDLLRQVIYQNARIEAREPGEFDKNLAKDMKAAEKQFNNLQVRLAKAKNSLSVGKKHTPESVSESSSKAPTKRETAQRVPKDYDDLIDALAKL